MAGKIYGVGVGPGDPELLTIKAARLIKNAGVIGIPAEHKETCKAYQIAAGAVEEIREKEVVPFPFLMTRDPERLKESHDRLAEKAAGYLDQGRDLVFLTLGDPAVYSTYMYLHRRLTAMGYEAEIVSGVTSFCAAAARLSVSLGDGSTPIHILPGSFPLEEGLSLPGTRVLMKSGKQMGAVKKALVSGEYEVLMAENCGMEGERLIGRAQDIPEDAGYISWRDYEESDPAKFCNGERCCEFADRCEAKYARIANGESVDILDEDADFEYDEYDENEDDMPETGEISTILDCCKHLLTVAGSQLNRLADE